MTIVNETLKASYLRLRTEYDEQESEYDETKVKANAERDRNRAMSGTALGHNNEPEEEARKHIWATELERKDAVFNQAYDRMHRARQMMLEDCQNTAEQEYLEAALTLIDKWGQLTAVYEVMRIADLSPGIGRQVINGLSIPASPGPVMKPYSHVKNGQPNLVSLRHRELGDDARLEKLRGELEV
jgi:hypothetical protein